MHLLLSELGRFQNARCNNKIIKAINVLFHVRYVTNCRSCFVNKLKRIFNKIQSSVRMYEERTLLTKHGHGNLKQCENICVRRKAPFPSFPVMTVLYQMLQLLLYRST